MNLSTQKEVIAAYRQYTTTNRDIIKANLNRYLQPHSDNKQLPIVARNTGISLETLYQIRKTNVDYIPDFIPAMILCNCLEIPITALCQESPGIPITDITVTSRGNNYNSKAST